MNTELLKKTKINIIPRLKYVPVLIYRFARLDADIEVDDAVHMYTFLEIQHEGHKTTKKSISKEKLCRRKEKNYVEKLAMLFSCFAFFAIILYGHHVVLRSYPFMNIPLYLKLLVCMK